MNKLVLYLNVCTTYYIHHVIEVFRHVDEAFGVE